MAYPNFKNKHLGRALFSPDPHKDTKKSKEKIPKCCIILYHDKPLRYLKKRFSGKYKKLKFRHLWACEEAYYTKNFVFVKSRMGSPMAVCAMEQLIPLGIKKFLNIGIAGGLQNPGFFLCTKAIRDEGTSPHYLKHSKYVYPDKELTKKLEECFKKRNVNYEKGATWTIDAPYRETKEEVSHYKKLGITNVEMEASALFALAQLRGVKIASAFFTSDILGEKKWEDLYRKNPDFVKNGFKMLAKIAVDCFSH